MYTVDVAQGDQKLCTCTWDAQFVARARCSKPEALSAFAAVLINICSLISLELHAEKQSE